MQTQPGLLPDLQPKPRNPLVGYRITLGILIPVVAFLGFARLGHQGQIMDLTSETTRLTNQVSGDAETITLLRSRTSGQERQITDLQAMLKSCRAYGRWSERALNEIETSAIVARILAVADLAPSETELRDFFDLNKQNKIMPAIRRAEDAEKLCYPKP